MAETPPFEPERLFKPILDNTNDVIVVTTAHDLDRSGPTILYINPAFTKLTGYDRAEIIGKHPSLLYGPETDTAALDQIRAALEAARPIHTELVQYKKTGEPYWSDVNILPLRDEDGHVTHFASIQRDITARKQLEEDLIREATTDTLTGLHNRRAFFDIAEAEIARARRYGNAVSLIAVDVDRLKWINDSYGHIAGDAALQRFAESCRRLVREIDAVARLSGGEFAILLPETPLAGAACLAERIRAAVHDLALIANGQRFEFTVSLGLATYRAHGDSLQALLSRADRALQQAKRTGRDRICTAESEEAKHQASA